MKQKKDAQVDSNVFKDIFLENLAYPCVMYVKERLGLSLDIKELLNLEGEPFIPGKTELKAGDIIVYKNTEGQSLTRIWLKVQGKSVITKWADVSKHFYVYEGDGIVSDMVYSQECTYPVIRMKDINDLDAPNYVIRRESL